jgi:hypothetical protein
MKVIGPRGLVFFLVTIAADAVRDPYWLYKFNYLYELHYCAYR